MSRFTKYRGNLVFEGSGCEITLAIAGAGLPEDNDGIAIKIAEDITKAIYLMTSESNKEKKELQAKVAKLEEQLAVVSGKEEEARKEAELANKEEEARKEAELANKEEEKAEPKAAKEAEKVAKAAEKVKLKK